MKTKLAAAGLVAGLVGGGLAGLALGSSGLAGAQSTPPSTTTTEGPGTAAINGSNEDQGHEAGESAAREADEANGHVGGRHEWIGGHGSNEDPTHEKGESAAREAQEDTPPPATGAAPGTAPAN
ncbi:MAG: hypothetical protein QOI47_157 [Actinomycetota bacterium]|nr:hypothetical protein [Actinomycetota bacterium]